MNPTETSDSFSDLFASEPAAVESATSATPATPALVWKVMLVDDEPDIHAVLRMALQDVDVQGRRLQLIDAHSATEAKACLDAHPDIALILLDVVMESEQAGLDLVRHIRQERGNRSVQIVLVTGQPGYAPQRKVVTDYAIDGYRLKSELTADKIFVSVFAALRTHQALIELATYRDHLESLVAERTVALTIAKVHAEAANRAKSVFLSNMSHELRTPLNAILGFAQILTRDERIPEDERKNIATINRAGDHLLSLINDVLEISRIEAGQTAVQNVPFDLAAALSEVEEMIRVRAEAKDLDLSVERHGELPAYVLGDAHRLRQVLINLLGNAVKFTQHGQIRLSVTALPADQVRFEVIDTGVGIEANEQASIFQPFYQTKIGIAAGEGTGLGLTISHEFIRLMGGELSVRSVPGQGSTFSFAVPLAPTFLPHQASVHGRVLGLSAGQAAPRILVAEDHPDNQQVIFQLLTQAGFKVRIASDGHQALDLFQTWQPQLILMDMRMPVMDGYQTTRAIRSLANGATLPIIALTASAMESDRSDIFAAGCNEFVRKPVEVEPLFEMIAKYLHLRYDYANLPTPEEHHANADLSALPAAVRTELAHAAIDLDKEATLALVERLQPDFPQQASTIAALVEEYQFDQLRALLEALPTELPTQAGIE
jgi:signal transduction histidine kinase